MADPSSDQIAVVVVDDHAMFAESLGMLLSASEGIDVVGVVSDARSALGLVAARRPQVVLVDFQMPDMDGVSLTAKIKREHPETKVVMLTGAADDQVLLGAIEAGCSGFLTKDRASAEVVAAVRAVAAGEALISPAMLARLLPKLNRSYRPVGSDLTERERQVLRALAEGRTNNAIASDLHLSVNTVRNYVQAVLTKLGAHSKLEAVATAVREGIISHRPG